MKLVVLPTGADLDALSSAYGVLLLYPDAKMVRPLQLSKSAAAVFKKYKHLFEGRLIGEVPKEVETLILVDTCGFERIPSVPHYGELLIYDHHPRCGERKFERATLKVDRVGAATTLVVEEIRDRKVELSPEGATLLLMGIYEDTGNFTHLGTTPRDLEAAAFLLSKGADLKEVDRFVNEKLTAEELEVVYKLLRSIEYIETPEGFRVAIATFKGEEYFPEFQELVYRMKEFTERVDGFFIVYEAGNKTYLFGRAVNPNFDASAVLRRLGGGGHGAAASLKVEGIPAERVKKRLVDVLTGNLPNIYLENFISYPPLVVRADEGVREALQRLVDFGFAGAPVVDEEGRPLGVVFKKDLLRALKHLGDKPLKVSEVLNPDVRVLHLRDTIWEAENILSKFGQKLIPVVNDAGRVVGVLTRLDIFKNILSETPERVRQRKIELPENIRDFAEEVGKLAKRLGLRAYIVGGVVRDIILGRPVWDLDIVVEGGDATELAKAVGELYGVKVHPFEEFGTAHLKVGNLKVEFATARRESYERSGAYPKVEPASLKEDIFRRDFTINTLAVALNPEDFGQLIDYLGGLEDLRRGIVRVLHSLSFVEDPIRILRALRFAGRFGFDLSKGTKTLLRRAVDLGVLKNAPRGRVANELRLALREDRFLEILKLYKEYKILEQILPEGFQWSKIREEELKKLKSLLEEFPEISIPGWVLFISLLLGLEKEKALGVLKELSAPAKVREIYLQAKDETWEILKTLKGAKKPSDLAVGLKRYHPETLLLVASKGDRRIENLVRFYLKEVKPFKAKVDVERLKREGLKGKELGKAIEREKMRILDETLKGRFEGLLTPRGES
ncbi:MAG TPA: CBS domain-containing protein [Aquifex sp.]|nr:CBS domain-containing protein [Aquifex sp.]